MWLLQRHTNGVDYRPTQVPSDVLALGARVQYANDSPAAIVCNVATAERDWATPRTWGDVVRR